MLCYFLFPRLRGYPEEIIFEQDGAPPHYSFEVREYLDRKLPNRWMERGGIIEWPSRSPDLTPCDYFLWGYIKDKVLKESPRIMAELNTKIQQTIQTLDQEP